MINWILFFKRKCLVLFFCQHFKKICERVHEIVSFHNKNLNKNSSIIHPFWHLFDIIYNNANCEETKQEILEAFKFESTPRPFPRVSVTQLLRTKGEYQHFVVPNVWQRIAIFYALQPFPTYCKHCFSSLLKYFVIFHIAFGSRFRIVVKYFIFLITGAFKSFHILTINILLSK